MELDNSKYEWLVLSAQSKEVHEGLVRLLDAQEVALECLTTVRVEGEPAASFWNPQRRLGGPEQEVGSSLRYDPRARKLVQWLVICGIGGATAVLAGLTGVVPTLSFGLLVIAIVIMLGLALWQIELLTFQNLLATLTGHAAKNRADPEVANFPAGQHTLPNRGVGEIPVSELVEARGAAPIILGIKFGEADRERIEQVINKLGARRVPN
ncbi:MAG: hypothetical protein EBU88_13445 [Acidobacteria bacterium]|nr:hypothetical protein [Acidobacteriota bacterium]